MRRIYAKAETAPGTAYAVDVDDTGAQIILDGAQIILDAAVQNLMLEELREMIELAEHLLTWSAR